MASKKPDNGGGTLNRLAGRGEEAVTKLVEELSKNPRVTDALSRVMDAKTRIDQSARGAVAQAGLAAADELKDLRKQIERLERRLAKLESSGSKPAAAKSTTAKKAETKKAPTTKKRTTVKKDAEKAPSPAPGRSIGGGSGRGSSAS